MPPRDEPHLAVEHECQRACPPTGPRSHPAVARHSHVPASPRGLASRGVIRGMSGARGSLGVIPSWRRRRFASWRRHRSRNGSLLSSIHLTWSAITLMTVKDKGHGEIQLLSAARTFLRVCSAARSPHGDGRRMRVHATGHALFTAGGFDVQRITIAPYPEGPRLEASTSWKRPRDQ
jgi:hypothetical protein